MAEWNPPNPHGCEGRPDPDRTREIDVHSDPVTVVRPGPEQFWRPRTVPTGGPCLRCARRVCQGGGEPRPAARGQPGCRQRAVPDIDRLQAEARSEGQGD